MGKLKRGFEPAAFGVGHLRFAMIRYQDKRACSLAVRAGDSY